MIDNEFYLKSAICYVIKNAPAGGLPYTAYDYPWGSGSLYFRCCGEWSSPNWTYTESFITNNSNIRDGLAVSTLGQLTVKEKRKLFNSSPKQICRVCGLLHTDVTGLL